MPADRFFTRFSLKTSSLTLRGDEFHHLAHVMRIRIGETFELVNGHGEFAEAEIVTLGKHEAELKITSYTSAPPPATTLILAQALTRPASLEWIIEKGTELGVTEFWLYVGEHTEKKSPSMPRLETIAISALKQCGRLYLPKILLKPPLKEWEKPPGSLFFGDLSKEAKPLEGPFSSNVTFFIGPEKGFSSQELEILAKKFQAKGISLHENILRAETAAIAALSQYYSESKSSSLKTKS